MGHICAGAKFDPRVVDERKRLFSDHRPTGEFNPRPNERATRVSGVFGRGGRGGVVSCDKSTRGQGGSNGGFLITAHQPPLAHPAAFVTLSGAYPKRRVNCPRGPVRATHTRNTAVRPPSKPILIPRPLAHGRPRECPDGFVCVCVRSEPRPEPQEPRCRSDFGDP